MPEITVCYYQASTMDIGEKWRPNLLELNNGGRGNGVGNNNNTNLIYNLEYIQ